MKKRILGSGTRRLPACLALALAACLSAAGAQAPKDTSAGNELLLGESPGDSPLAPKVGDYPVTKVEVLPSEQAGGPGIIRLDRTGGETRRLFGRFSRMAEQGEHLRFSFRARLLEGTHLIFGFSSGREGLTLDGFAVSCSIRLDGTGVICAFDGETYQKIPNLPHNAGEWQSYSLDYVVGCDQMLLTAGGVQTTVTAPFSQTPGGFSPVERIFFAAAAPTTLAEVSEIEVFVVKEKPLSDLPSFGAIRWVRNEIPSVRAGPKGGISGQAFVAAGGKLYLGGGFIPGGDGSAEKDGRTSRTVECFDPATGAWTRLPDLPERREYLLGLTEGTTIYFLGGAKQQPYEPHAEVYALDVAKRAPVWLSLPPLGVPRTHLAGGVVGRRLIVAGGNQYDGAVKGYHPTTIRDTVEMLDLDALDAGWKIVASLPAPARGWTSSVAANERLYLFGGATLVPKQADGSGGKFQKIRETLSYDVRSNTWKKLTPPPFAISGWRGALYKNRYAILIGGVFDTEYFRSHRWNAQPLVYDTVDDKWYRFDASATPPGGAYNDPGVAIIGDTIYVTGAEAMGAHYNTLLVGTIEPRLGGAVSRE